MHLSQTPGIRKHFDNFKTNDLFQILLKRSYKQLYGAQFTASCKLFNFKGGEIDVRASCVDRDAKKMLLVSRDQKGVYLAHVGRKKISLQYKLGPAWDVSGKVQVLKTAFDQEGGLYVLQLFTATDVVDWKSAPSFMKQAWQPIFRHMMYLACYKKESAHRAFRVIPFRHNVYHEPRALAAFDCDKFMISWRHLISGEPETTVYRNKTTYRNSSGVFSH